MPRLLPALLALAAATFAFAPSTHAAAAAASADLAALVPPKAPRTLVLAGRADDFRAYVRTGEGRAAFERLRADFDAEFLKLPFPPEPKTYGDPTPRLRDSDKADKWRADQDTAGLISGVAEAGALLWLGTGERKYLEKAKEFILRSSEWSLDPSGWPQGPSLGATDVFYNDEAHFRLWRKLPLVYDLIRDEFTDAERAKILAHFRERGERGVQFIRRGRVEQAQKNSLAGRPSSHPIRFMAMTGLTALALWDDLPEQARDWWQLAYTFYRDRFPSWGGDDGGWAEGVAYWRGTMEHAAFQDALVAIGDPLAYNTPFWRNTPYFQVYTVQPFRHTAFGDLSNAGKFDIEPRSAEFLLHLARVLRDGRLVTYADLANVKERAAESGLRGLNRLYPTAAEFLLRNFTVAHLALPAPRPLDDLPPSRHFADIGWVAMHSALGRPDDNIHVAFKSSPYGSFSHSHADQNAFILNAWGENLAINSGYREFHRSPHHQGWTWQTKSKNAILIDGQGQKPQDLGATGRITRFDTGPRHTWTTGDATVAYSTMQPAGRVRAVLRDLVFIDQRYLVVRDQVELADPGKLTWLLHAERPIEWKAAEASALIRGERATLSTRLLAPAGVTWQARVQNHFDVPVDPKYVEGGVSGFGQTGRWGNQSHLFAETAEARASHLVVAVLWPERNGLPARPLAARLSAEGEIEIRRPDGKTDRLVFEADALRLR
jgi:hypothetical protein